MELTKDNIQQYVGNPEAIQYQIINMLEEANDNKLKIVSANHPAMLLLETAATLAASNMSEAVTLMRTKFPSLATSKKDLFHHFTDEEINGIFSKPGDSMFYFTVNYNDLVSHGVRNEERGYIETMIPSRTFFKVKDLTFTLLNDIVIRLYDNDSVFVEYLPSDNPNAIKDTGILNSVLEVKNDVKLIRFEARVKQCTILHNRFTPSISEGLAVNVPITDGNMFFYAEVSYQNSATGNKKNKLVVKYDESYIDPTIPTAFVSVVGNTSQNSLSDTAIQVVIPAMYFKDGPISGEILIDVYETRGNVDVPIKFINSSEYRVERNTDVTDIRAASIKDIHFDVLALDYLSNGSNGLTFAELRDSVINNTIGEQQLPVTEAQLIHNNKLDGFEVFKGPDVLTSRTFIISKDLSKDGVGVNSPVKAANEVYFNTVPLTLWDNLDHPYISTFEDNFIIHSNAVFKYDNGKTQLLSKEDLEKIRSLQDENLINELQKFKYMYTPYTYIIDKGNINTTVRVYDFDRPTLSAKQIIATNSQIVPRSEILHYKIDKVSTGYKILIYLKHNAEATAIVNNIRVAMSIPLISNNDLFIYGEWSEHEQAYAFFIESNMYTTAENQLKILNGTSTTYNNYSNIDNTVSFYIYAINNAILDESGFMSNTLYGTKDEYVILTKETMNISLGKVYNHLWAPISIRYTDRKFKTYDDDIPARYEETVYEVDPSTGYKFTMKDGVPHYKILHHKDEIVKDVNGNVIYKHKKGDIIYDNTGRPIIDKTFGIIRDVVMVMLDYEFMVIQDKEKKHKSYGSAYTVYNRICLDQLDTIMLSQIPSKNQHLLENTTMFYRSKKSSLPVKVKLRGILQTLNNRITPHVTVYIKSNNDRVIKSDYKNNVRDIIGITIDKYLSKNKTIRLAELKNLILKEMEDDVIGVKLQNIEPTNSELFEVVDASNGLSVNKVLDIDNYNKLYVRYDVSVDIVTGC